jgi:hypothetical protein
VGEGEGGGEEGGELTELVYLGMKPPATDLGPLLLFYPNFIDRDEFVKALVKV